MSFDFQSDSGYCFECREDPNQDGSLDGVQVAEMYLVSKRVVPDGRRVVNDGRDTGLVELSHLLRSQVSKPTEGDRYLCGAFDGLLYVLFPAESLIEDDA